MRGGHQRLDSCAGQGWWRSLIKAGLWRASARWMAFPNLAEIYAATASDFRDITSGANNTYSAGGGYDLVTGRGTPLANLIVPAYGPSTVAGEVFNDANGNATLDNGETGLSGWTVYEDLNNNGVNDPATTNTFNSSGSVGINTNSTATSNNIVSLPANSTITKLTVTLNITFSRDSNLGISLVSPGNVTVSLANHVAVPPRISRTRRSTISRFRFRLPLVPRRFQARTRLPARWRLCLEPIHGDLETAGRQFLAESNRTTANSWSMHITSGDLSTTTNSNGLYQLVNPISGTYRVSEVVQWPYSQTSPGGGSYNTSIGTGVYFTGDNLEATPPAPHRRPSPTGDERHGNIAVRRSDEAEQ